MYLLDLSTLADDKFDLSVASLLIHLDVQQGSTKPFTYSSCLSQSSVQKRFIRKLCFRRFSFGFCSVIPKLTINNKYINGTIESKVVATGVMLRDPV